MGRPSKCRRVESLPGVTVFKPAGVPMDQLDEVRLTLEGFNALRLIDVEGFDQTEVAARMGVSRQTVGRILGAARRILASAVVDGRALRIEGGNYMVRESSGDGRPGTPHRRESLGGWPRWAEGSP